MEINKLRTLIRESIQEYIKEIDEAAETAAMEARIAKCDEAIATRETKLSAIAESDHKDLMDEGKIKGLENEIKELKKAKAKFEKIAEKKAAKKAKKSAPKEEVVTDTMTEEAPVDEADVMAEMDVTDKAVEETAINESFLKMQKLAGVITEAQYNEKKRLIENQLKEISLSGVLNKVKDKIVSLPAFSKLINSVVAKMSEKDKENFKTKFNLAETKGAPSLEDIMTKVDAINPDKDVKTPEELKEGAEDIMDKISYEVVRLVKNLTGLNLLALGGVPFGFVINYLIDMSPWSFGAFVGPVISLVVSLIIHGISRKLLGLTGDDGLIGESEDQQKELTPKEVAQIAVQNIDKLKSDPKLKAIADKIAANPKATEELNKMLANINISLNEGDIDVNPQDVYKIALTFAKKADTLNEESDYGWTIPTGLFGGGILAHYIASLGDVITPHMQSMGYSPSHMTASIVGGLSAAALLVIGQYVYNKLNK